MLSSLGIYIALLESTHEEKVRWWALGATRTVHAARDAMHAAILATL